MDQMDVNGHYFNVISLLGKGKGGYSYLVCDEAGEYVLKQIPHEPCDYYQFGDKLASELRDYEHLRQLGIPMPQLLDVDHRQERILKQYIKGDTVMQMVKEDRLEPGLIRQMEQMCQLLYPANTNIDYFPTNFVEQDGKLFYIDYECNPYMQQWDFANWGIKYWSKTPELMEYLNNHG